MSCLVADGHLEFGLCGEKLINGFCFDLRFDGFHFLAEGGGIFRGDRGVNVHHVRIEFVEAAAASESFHVISDGERVCEFDALAVSADERVVVVSRYDFAAKKARVENRVSHLDHTLSLTPREFLGQRDGG